MGRQLGSPRYNATSVAMHWTMAVLILAVYAAINLADVFPKGSDARQSVKDWHFMLGLLVFALVWLRVVLRWVGTTPPIVPTPSAWQEKAGKAVHLLLYLLMLAMPLLGWMVLSFAGKSIPFFGLDLPALLAPDKALGRQLKDIHELGGNLGYALIGGHAAAALFHHYVLRDNTLARMWFRFKRPT